MGGTGRIFLLLILCFHIHPTRHGAYLLVYKFLYFQMDNVKGHYSQRATASNIFKKVWKLLKMLYLLQKTREMNFSFILGMVSF